MLDYLLMALKNTNPDRNRSYIKLFIDFISFGTVYKKEKRFYE